MSYLETLFRKIEAADAENFFEYESEIFLELDCMTIKPDCVTAFLTICSWFGTSGRSGVWTFYETADSEAINITLKYLSDNGYNYLKEIFEKGIHDYNKEKYQKNYDYPEEWLEESVKIDDWIKEHELSLWEWKRNILLENKLDILR